jgi:flagellar protein FliO/FliZ
MTRHHYSPFALIFFIAITSAHTAFANTANAPAINAATSPVAGFFQILFGLIAVLAIMAFAAWSFKKIGPVTSLNKLPVKVIGGVSVGNREKIMVIEVADQWLVVGVTSNQINTLSTLNKQEQFLNDTVMSNPTEQFSSWLKKTIEKRNATSTSAPSDQT